MTEYFLYVIIFVVLLVSELVYFKIANKYNIIDKPNERSSHSSIVLRGGGIIFLIGLWVWAISTQVSDDFSSVLEVSGIPYVWFLLAVTLIAGISFIDDIYSLPDSVRLVGQFAAMILMFYQLDMLHMEIWWVVLLALIVCVGASNIINFMDGVNGITGAYAFASLIPLYLLNEQMNFVDPTLIITLVLDDLYVNLPFPSVFALIANALLPIAFVSLAGAVIFWSLAPFAGDVGSIGVAYILLFFIGALIMKTADVTYLIFLLVYGVDGVLAICHRIMLHENLGQAHRKHAYQLIANELKIGHVTVSLLYMVMQLVVSLGFIYVCPDTVAAHWMYMISSIIILSVAYVLFKKKYYHLHEEYLASLK